MHGQQNTKKGFYCVQYADLVFRVVTPYGMADGY